jgi:hypothetical protein
MSRKSSQSFRISCADQLEVNKSISHYEDDGEIDAPQTYIEVANAKQNRSIHPFHINIPDFYLAHFLLVLTSIFRPLRQ